MAVSIPKKLSLDKYGPLIALVVLVIASTILYPRFIEIQNLLNILRQVSYTGIIALGMTFVIISGGIDLSVGSMTAFAGAFAILTLNAVTQSLVTFSPFWLRSFLSILAAATVSVAIALVGGAMNGFLVTKGRIAPFNRDARHLGDFCSLPCILGKLAIQVGEFVYGEDGNVSDTRCPLPVWISFLLAAGLSFVLNRNKIRRLRVWVGSNEKVARYSAITWTRSG
jgi:ribose transport system permease protein